GRRESKWGLGDAPRRAGEGPGSFLAAVRQKANIGLNTSAYCVRIRLPATVSSLDDLINYFLMRCASNAECLCSVHRRTMSRGRGQNLRIGSTRDWAISSRLIRR